MIGSENLAFLDILLRTHPEQSTCRFYCSLLPEDTSHFVETLQNVTLNESAPKVQKLEIAVTIEKTHGAISRRGEKHKQVQVEFSKVTT